jgi:hypothetical protein
LGKYILYCSERQSPFGIVDHNISAEEAGFMNVKSENTTLNAAANGIIGSVPFVGEMQDIIEATGTINALPWSTGANCVARTNDSAFQDAATNAASNSDLLQDTGVDMNQFQSSFGTMSTVSWSEMRRYQRYIEDDRIIQSTNPEAGSAVIAFLDDHYARNPRDPSYEGHLARITGMTKETIIATLDQVEHENFLAQYDPTELGPVPANHQEVPLVEQVPSIIIADHSVGPTSYHVIYADTRMRSYTV